MFQLILKKLFGTKHEREVKRIMPLVQAVEAQKPYLSSLSNQELQAKTGYFKEKLSQGATIDDILVEAFAVVREVGRRTLNMEHFPVQIIGAKVLLDGRVAEMKTGEGKTLVATMPAYLRALEGKGVHIVTVNDYLARRDAEWMGKIYHFLGLEVGVIQAGMGDQERKKAYHADITYGTNNEFGFDYLRDNMKFRLEDRVQRGHYFAIVDEVDSILIDEARTPLIISGPSEQSTHIYARVNRIVPRLKPGVHFEVDEKNRNAPLNEEGVALAEKLLGVDNLYDPRNMDLLHALQQAIRAHTLFHKDVDYIIKDGEVIIVDEFTGRLMPGRRWSDGLHQAIEAKEGVKIKQENQTLATITLQNYFRMYEILSGMTGTAATEETEFVEIYDLDVVVIPTHKPMIRKDHPDVIYRTKKEKWKAVIEEIIDCHKRGQPVLVGTVSIENSELISKLLRRRNIPHVVLNAKYHEREAEIVAQAGRKGAVTIATNMAGRGTDILLGGNPEFLAKKEVHPEEGLEKYNRTLQKYKEICKKEREEVLQAGGLHILGTERHESRRIDNQLRGRSGRQGDPGSSRFYLSLEDDLMRIFASEKTSRLLERFGMKEGVPIESKMISRAIERAQKQVEMHHFEIRKQLLKYDDVMNKQREAIYTMRTEILEHTLDREYILDLANNFVTYLVDQFCPKNTDPEDWDIKGLVNQMRYYFGLSLEEKTLLPLGETELKQYLQERIQEAYQAKIQRVGDELMRIHEQYVMLSVVDHQWKDHLLALDHLKEGIGMRAYGQRDPLVEYKRESFELFQNMMDRIEEQIIQYCFQIEPIPAHEELPQTREADLSYSRPEFIQTPRRAQPIPNRPAPQVQTVVRKGPKIGRNDPCPCGSGKKYKKCCGA